ncbi:hypothetical protein SMD44_00056 [Streptomyces alboflavus]|uniref:Uncharacterized protein n=1 Tax=Streptomyces alboflavus TaxID=67267 RepID=A0A1Z1W2K7_9ACTN|nr:hypothetical protein [Streptomyces alboflavus]ARX80658.1 hypothetical protein SMD44_00056 [Streptomyces alboflavus]
MAEAWTIASSISGARSPRDDVARVLLAICLFPAASSVTVSTLTSAINRTSLVSRHLRRWWMIPARA